tara:strand:- start:2248 stop:3123 length:876 start_codon:yes stop_codon:yes gene_type:complete
MATFSNANYSGPFSSKYEEAEALSGERGNRAAYMASQAAHSRGLRDKKLRDTSSFGTQGLPFGIGGTKGERYAAPGEDPKNQNPFSPATNYGRNPQPFSSPMQQGPFAPNREVPLGVGYDQMGGMFPSLAGSGPDSRASTGNPLKDLSNFRKSAQQDMAMAGANLLGGGAFTNNPQAKMQSFIDMGFSLADAEAAVNRDIQADAQRALTKQLYGDRRNERGTQGTQATAPTEEADPNYIPPHLRALMAQQQAGTPPVQMNMGGIMSLRPRMEMDQYSMGRDLAMRDMGRSV